MLCREQLAQLSVHADIASKLNRLIDEKALVDMGKLEQDLVYGNATSKEVVTFLGYHQQLPTPGEGALCSLSFWTLGTALGQIWCRRRLVACKRVLDWKGSALLAWPNKAVARISDSSPLKNESHIHFI